MPSPSPSSSSQDRAWEKRALKLLGQAGKRGLLEDDDPTYKADVARLSKMGLLTLTSRDVRVRGRFETQDYWKTSRKGDLAAKHRTFDPTRLEELLKQPNRIPYHRRRSMEAVKLAQRTRSYTEHLIHKTIGSIEGAAVLDSGWIQTAAKFKTTPVGKIVNSLDERSHYAVRTAGMVHDFGNVGFSTFEAIALVQADLFSHLKPEEGCPVSMTRGGLLYALTRFDGGAIAVTFSTDPVFGEYAQRLFTEEHYRGFILASSEAMLMNITLELR